MLFTSEYILSKCYSHKVYAKGREIFNNEYVNSFGVESNEKGDFVVEAEVEGSGYNSYTVSLSIEKRNNEGLLKRANCECKAVREYPGICKHIVATMLMCNNYFASNSVKGVVKTSEQIQNIMQHFILKEKGQYCMQYGNGDITLSPVIKIGRERDCLEFRIGRKNMYVVKDIYELADSIKEARRVSYGKNLEFVHYLSAFTRESQPLIQMLIDYVEQVQENNYFLRYSNASARKSISLSRTIMDKLMEMYEGQNIYFEFESLSEKKEIAVSKENPRLNINITAKDNNAILEMGNILTLEGAKQMYVYSNDIINKCSEEYYTEMRSFLDLMQQQMREASRSYKSKKLVNNKYSLSQNDFSIFAANVLPVLHKHTNVKIKGLDFSAYQPEEALIKIYLDLDKKKRVICKVIAQYGYDKLNILMPERTGQQHRDLKKELLARSTVEKYFKDIDEEENVFLLADDVDSLFNLLQFGIEELNEHFEVFASDAIKNINVIKVPAVNTGVSLSGDLLEFKWNINDFDISQLNDILKSYKKRKKFHRLKNGDFVNIQDNGLELLSELSDGLNLTSSELQSGNVQLPKYRALYLDSVMRQYADNTRYTRNNEFKKLIRQIKSTEDSDYTVPQNITAELRNYQEIGYQWLCTLTEYSFGGILADDMGLGKTLQIIALLASKNDSKSLIVCPASLVYNWENEFSKFCSSLVIRTVVGSADERASIINDATYYDVMITSYDLLKRDLELYQNIKFDFQIIDEAQYIKNSTTQASRAVKCINSTYRFALTGTPIENKLSDLWSIFDFVMPGYLYTYNKFKEELEAPIVQQQDNIAVARMQRMIRPFILRRLKRDVLKELPDKLEEVVFSKMEGKQREIYEAKEKKLVADLSGLSDQDYATGKLQILAALTELRQLCCDPGLCLENYQEGSSKLETCVELLHNAIEGGHKVLLFSQFTTMLSRIEERLKKEGIKSLLLTGKTTKETRKQLVNEFQSGNGDVFLISLKAGGTGLNLTAADMVIHYDPWWNVAAQNQATDRAHRIGQENSVTEIKLIAKNTIEEKILKLQERKKELADQIISEEGISLSAISKSELLEILEG